jgi:hypothetical protein
MAFPLRAMALALVVGLGALSGCGGGGGGGGGDDFLDPSQSDQSLTVEPFTCSVGLGDVEQAMSFTAGLSGTLLQIDLFLVTGGTTADDDIQVELRPMLGGVPDPDAFFFATALSTNDLATDDFEFVSLDVSAADFQVVAGVEYAIVLRALLPTTGGSWGGTSDETDYAGGDAFSRPALADDFQANGCDLAFRTYVE